MSASPAWVGAAFRQRFGSRPAIYRAPGRVNLIGEHTDYNGGYVLPAAIALYAYVAAAPRSDGIFRIASCQFPDEVCFDAGNTVATAGRGGALHWSDYVTGVIRVLLARGVPLRGADLLIHGEVPLGSGLSSSAALELAAALALSAAAGRQIERSELARICQEAENVHVGMRCGIMDQFASAHGRAGHALLLDCRTLEHRLLPLSAGPEGPEVEIVICNSMVRHQLAGSEYNRRRGECEEGVRILARHDPAVRELRDVNADLLDSCREELGETLLRRCRHVVTENARVLAAAQALGRGELGRFGRLMADSHASLRDDYQVSCGELDELVRIGARVEGVLGTRMTGGGFGGCTVSLVRRESVERFRAEVAREYLRSTGLSPDITVCSSADGAQPVETP